MKTVIIYAHPWDGSFNHHILEKTISLLKNKGEEVDVIDLYKEGFNPVLSKEDLSVFSKGLYRDPKAEAYASRLKNADNAIFIFPIWWYGLPAILKGFFDKVMLKGTTYIEDEDHNLSGALDIKKSAVFTTANIDKEFMASIGDPINNALIEGIFKRVGIEQTTWIHCPTVHDEKSRANFLNEIEAYLNK